MRGAVRYFPGGVQPIDPFASFFQTLSLFVCNGFSTVVLCCSCPSYRASQCGGTRYCPGLAAAAALSNPSCLSRFRCRISPFLFRRITHSPRRRRFCSSGGTFCSSGGIDGGFEVYCSTDRQMARLYLSQGFSTVREIGCNDWGLVQVNEPDAISGGDIVEDNHLPQEHRQLRSACRARGACLATGARV